MTLRFVIAGAAACIFAMQAAALDISNRYLSPRNPERKVRASTSLIILHTTEAPARSSLNKVSDRGECHYCVTEEGSVYAIVDRDREAFHAGRSMWHGKDDVDKYSIGIECVGYHDKPMGAPQLRAIAELVKMLQKMYRIPDHCVIAHSHVAYGAPNKWQKHNHRGRKRCGMLFATKTIRSILDLKSKPGSDADVAAGRLTVGDPYLEKVLYRNEDHMAKYYATKPSPTMKAMTATKKPAPKPTDIGKQVVKKLNLNQKDKTLKSIAQLKAHGYTVRGTISKNNTAAKIAGRKWNAEDTYYTIRDKVYSGKTINPKRIEKGMQVWLKK